MTRARRRDAKGRRYGARFSRTVEDEVQHGIHWPDYRHPLTRYLLPRHGATATEAERDIRLARASEIADDELEAGDPGTPPPWPHYEGQP